MPLLNPIRRSQLVSPFGPGALFVTKDGISVMTAALDYWFRYEDGSLQGIDLEGFKIHEWRLARMLKVSYFLEPPDYRKQSAISEKINLRLTVPTVRFPTWHWCQSCQNLYQFTLHESTKLLHCQECLNKERKRRVVQVPFIAICPHGHIQEFPFREWVHFSVNPDCQGQLKLMATGGATLGAQKITCSCNASRAMLNIQGLINADRSKTVLSNNLDKKQLYNCKGYTPWCGDVRERGCGQPIRGALRSASNVYYGKIKSSIYLPIESSSAPADLLALFDEPPLSSTLQIFKGLKLDITPELLCRDEDNARILTFYSNDEIEAAIKTKLEANNGDPQANELTPGDDEETAFRRQEYKSLLKEQTLPDLIIRANDIESYSGNLKKWFSEIHSIHRLRETRALYGFTRIQSENDLTIDELRSLLFKTEQKPGGRWLPAYKVHGEGIFIVFRREKVKDWLRDMNVPEMNRRVKLVDENYSKLRAARGSGERHISPRFLLAHTFSHALIQRLIFECGYSSASLRERLYISDIDGAEMTAVLIYTAAGDSEGTMGGLVRMSKPGYLESCFYHSMDAARWCSNDPICMESGSVGGQGPDSCNLAACHSCSLLPETACEESNRFLDRAMLVGTLTNHALGFFTE